MLALIRIQITFNLFCCSILLNEIFLKNMFSGFVIHLLLAHNIYVDRSSDKKKLEVTFAKAEARHELLTYSAHPFITFFANSLNMLVHCKKKGVQ